jgi:hypothetical protein
MTIEAIATPAPARKRTIFAHGQRVDIVNAAMIEIARRELIRYPALKRPNDPIAK